MPSSSLSSTFNYNYYPTVGLAPNATALLFLFAGIVAAGGLIFFIFRSRASGFALLLIAVIISAAVWHENHAEERFLPVFSPKTMLDSLWENYKRDYAEKGSGRTVDTARNNITTSEGESYTMLRAVWIDDKTTFDASWAWTQKNLGRPKDHLFSWLYGRRSDGTMGILVDQGGTNTASDADTDITVALIFAYSRWQDPAYLKSAVAIIPDIWNKEVFLANGKPYLASHNLDLVSSSTAELVNPSYFAPYAYRIFGKLDSGRDWNGLIDTSYQLLNTTVVQPLDAPTSAYLPPDWVKVDAKTGAVQPTGDQARPTTFGYDALRIPFRLALDWQWSAEPRAKAILEKLGFLNDEWSRYGRLHAIYGHDGSVVAGYESPSMYGGTIGYFLLTSSSTASDIYLKKLQSLYNPNTQTWDIPLSYYDSNIVWFGMALMKGYLPNLFSLNFQAS